MGANLGEVEEKKIPWELMILAELLQLTHRSVY
jgi:hypothetical protein